MMVAVKANGQRRGESMVEQTERPKRRKVRADLASVMKRKNPILDHIEDEAEERKTGLSSSMNDIFTTVFI